MDRKQRVKIGSVLSDWLFPVNDGIPKSTILGSLLFLIMVNDLAINYIDKWKYVDNTALSKTFGKDYPCNVQTLLMSSPIILHMQPYCNWYLITHKKDKGLM